MKNRGRARIRTALPRIEALEERALLSGVTESLTTSQSVYQPGQPVQFVLTFTNTGSQVAQIDYGPSNDGFDVMQGGTLVHQSNNGINPMFLTADSLEPGESLTLDGTWNGASNQGSKPAAIPGTFTVTNQLDPTGASATFQIEQPSGKAGSHREREHRDPGSPAGQADRARLQSDQARPAAIDGRGDGPRGRAEIRLRRPFSVRSAR